MANLVIQRSDRYPVGTVVSLYAGITNRHHELSPAGSANATATVDAAGKLEYTGLTAGSVFTLWAEVGGRSVSMVAASAAPFPVAVPLRSRIAARRLALGT